MDDKVWEALGNLDAQSLLALIEEAAGKLAQGGVRNINAFIMVRGSNDAWGLNWGVHACAWGGVIVG